MLPNMRFPRLNIKLNITTVIKKNAKLKNANMNRHRQRNFFSFCILIRNCSCRGTSSVKSVSGRADGYLKSNEKKRIRKEWKKINENDKMRYNVNGSTKTQLISLFYVINKTKSLKIV